MATTAKNASGESRPVRKSKRGLTRREMILRAAAELFHHKGFHATGIDEIGAAVGITGPAVYRHFESKQDLLAAIVERALERHQSIVADAQAAKDPVAGVELLVRRSAEAQIDHRDAQAIYVAEGRSLADEDRVRFTRSQRNIVSEWVGLLRKARPSLPEEEARALVHAAGGVLNSTSYYKANMDREQLASLLAQTALDAMMQGGSRRSR
jgi:AcrR family transcriptional regulator